MTQDAVQGTYVEETFRFLALPEPWKIILVILPAVVLFAWWSYGGLSRIEPRRRVLLASLRGLAIGIALLAIFQPAFETKRYTQVQSQVHFLVDDSASMQRRDTYPDEQQRAALEAAAGVSDLASHDRSDLVRRVLERPGGLIEKIRKTHDVRLFKFSRKPLQIRDLSELQARGPRTHIGDALDLHRSAPGSANLDALILVSDGRNNGGQVPTEVASRYHDQDIPVYTIGVGDPNPPHNVRIIGPPGPREALRQEEVAFDVTLSAEGLAGRPVRVTLEGSRDGGLYLPLSTQPATLADNRTPVKVRLYHAFEEAGDWSLRFSVSTFPEETTIEDNVDTRFLRVDDQKIRVLYVEDLPRWEYRYVKNALLRVDPSIEVQAYMCDASHTWPQESSKGLPPLEKLPRSREEMFRYDVILIGDVPPEKLGATEENVHDWLELLVEFTESGGGVGFLFGPRAMPERYRGTPLEDLLPVLLEDPFELKRLEIDTVNGFVPQLENPTRPHDIVLLARDPKANERLWHQGFPPSLFYYPVQQAKAGAEVILRHPTDGNRYGKRVIMAASLYPRGRTFCIATDETWRMRYTYGDKYHDALWRNVVRYLAAGRLQRRDERFLLRLDKTEVDTGERVRISLEVLDDELEPSRAREFPVFLRRPDQPSEKFVLHAAPGSPGTYTGTKRLQRPGMVSVLVHANDNPQDAVLAREDLLVKIPDREMQRSSQDQDALQRIAKASKGGRYVFLAAAADLGKDFARRRPFEQEVNRATRPAWDSIWTLLAVLSVLAAEWILRKRARLV